MSNPSNLMFLNTAAGLIAGITCWIFVQTAINNSAIHRKALWHVGSTLFLVIIYGVTLGLATAGSYTSNPSSLYVTLAVASIVGINVFLLFFSLSYRQIVDQAPLPWLIASHVLRIGPGIIFLGLLDMGLLSRDFALQAGYGDIITGITALGVAYLISKRARYAREIAIVWGIFGLLDLINALYQGQRTLPGFITALGNQGQSISYFNWFLIIPMAAVPLFFAMHILLFRKIGLLFRVPKIDHQPEATMAT